MLKLARGGGCGGGGGCAARGCGGGGWRPSAERADRCRFITLPFLTHLRGNEHCVFDLEFLRPFGVLKRGQCRVGAFILCASGRGLHVSCAFD